MSALDKMQAGADKVHTALAKKGLREHTLDLVTPVPNDPLLGTAGTGVPTTVRLDPPPLVRNVSDKYIQAAGGVLQVGDILVSQISRKAVDASLINDPATVWVIGGPAFSGEYSIVGGTVRMFKTEWQVALRRKV